VLLAELERARDEGDANPGVTDALDQMIKRLGAVSSQVNTLSDRVSHTLRDRVGDTHPDTHRDRESFKELTEGSRKPSESKIVKRKASRIPADFSVTPEMVQWAKSRVPMVNGKLETEKFVNYWTAKSGASATKLDWPATWRNWMLEAGQRNGGGGQGALLDPDQPPPSPRDEFMRRR
jgi:hypothetical protein